MTRSLGIPAAWPRAALLPLFVAALTIGCNEGPVATPLRQPEGSQPPPEVGPGILLDGSPGSWVIRLDTALSGGILRLVNRRTTWHDTRVAGPEGFLVVQREAAETLLVAFVGTGNGRGRVLRINSRSGDALLSVSLDAVSAPDASTRSSLQAGQRQGDVDADGSITVRDAIPLLQALLAGPAAVQAIEPASDGDCDGTTGLTDALLILRYALRDPLLKAFCIGHDFTDRGPVDFSIDRIMPIQSVQTPWHTVPLQPIKPTDYVPFVSASRVTQAFAPLLQVGIDGVTLFSLRPAFNSVPLQPAPPPDGAPYGRIFARRPDPSPLAATLEPTVGSPTGWVWPRAGTVDWPPIKPFGRAMSVVFVPIQISSTGSVGAWNRSDEIARRWWEWLNRLPSVRTDVYDLVGPPLLVSANPCSANDWSITLLPLIESLDFTNLRATQHWKAGLVNLQGAGCGGGTRGIAYLPRANQRSGFSLVTWDDPVFGPSTLYHELGHTLNRRHAPPAGCADPASLDGGYPRPDGTVGEVYNITSFDLLYDPGATDIMNGCSATELRLLISEYTYTNMQEFLLSLPLPIVVTAAAPRQGLALLVRAARDSSGDWQLLPPAWIPAASVSSEVLEETNGGETVTFVLRGSTGDVLRRHTALIRRSPDAQPGTAVAFAAVPLGGVPASEVQALHLEAPGAARTSAIARLPLAPGGEVARLAKSGSLFAAPDLKVTASTISVITDEASGRLVAWLAGGNHDLSGLAGRELRVLSTDGIRILHDTLLR